MAKSTKRAPTDEAKTPATPARRARPATAVQFDIWHKLPTEWTIKDIGAPLLASLAEGLYDAHEILREYVQNAVDSYAEYRKLTGLEPTNTVQILVDEDAGDVHILDRGTGMDAEDLARAKSIAVSPKLGQPGEYVGFRGIGIWSGLSACDTLILETTKVGVPNVCRLRIDFKSIRERVYEPIPIDELLQGKIEISETPGAADDHYTNVRLVNIDRARYGVLLSTDDLIRYAEQNLPVPIDPDWGYGEDLKEHLKDVQWAHTYEVSIGGSPVFRRFPSADKVKAPEYKTIADSEGRPVAFAWFTETNSDGVGRKAIDIDEDKGEVSNFAVRLKNFTVGPRGLYADPQAVSDVQNLAWYVGEIYILDPDIKPDTNRRRFQRSYRSDAVIEALQDFYNWTAMGARGWSEEVTARGIAEEAEQAVSTVQRLLKENPVANKDRIREELPQLFRKQQRLKDWLDKADASPSSKKEPNAPEVVRRYLSKSTVRTPVKKALDRILALREEISALPPKAAASFKLDLPVNVAPKKAKSRARTAQALGKSTTPGAVMVPVGPAAGRGKRVEGDGSVGQTVDLDLAVGAFLASVAGVVGEHSDIYRRIEARLPQELRRRGIDV